MADNDLQIAIGIKAGNAKKKSAHCWTVVGVDVKLFA
jgi:hypothetical protein